MEEKKPKQDENTDAGEKRSDPKADARQSIGGRESLVEMRERLYARGKQAKQFKRSSLSQNKKDGSAVPNKWGSAPEQKKEAPRAIHKSIGTHTDIPQSAAVQQAEQEMPVSNGAPNTHAEAEPATEHSLAEDAKDVFMKTVKKKQGYRTKIVLAGLVFFVIAMALSSAFIWFGDNTISGENISINISDDQFSIGGGDELSFQVSVANQNAVPIESATLIINYPPGTQSAENPGEELFSQRIQLDEVKPGEAVNVPVKAIIFGEENQERTITAALEYRVRGSNATFFKEADPLRLKITSSPVSLKVDAVDSITSGQEMEFAITVTSNSPSPLSDVLVKASYPSGFDFTESSLDPVSGQDTWLIESLEPEGEESFTVKGLAVGKSSEEKTFRFSIGVPNERDRFNLASTFSTVSTGVQFEQPFLDIGIAVNGDTGSETVVIEMEESTTIDLTLTNTQDDTIYDGVVTAKLTGNAVNEVDVSVSNGHYDSTTNTITWDSVDVDSLSEIAPGRSSLVKFRVRPEEDTARTPEINLEVTAEGRRVFNDRASEKLEGSVSRTLRIESLVRLSSKALYSTGEFTNTGPIPPVAEKVTQYTLNFEAQNGSNDVTNAEVTAVLPPYVTWLDLKTSGDDITYDSPTRTVTWDIGDMDSNGREEASVQVSFTPSFSQVDTTPTILETTRFRATDRFTGTVIRAQSPALTTSLLHDPDEDTHNGRVQEEE